MLIKNFMIQNVITVQKDISVKELLKTLVTNRIGGVPVVSEDNRLEGMISDGDIIRYLHPDGRTIYDAFFMIFFNEEEDLNNKIKTLMNHQANEIVTEHIQTVKPNDNIKEALSIFAKHHFKKIPVVNEANKVVGVVSRGDIIRYISNEIITNVENK